MTAPNTAEIARSLVRRWLGDSSDVHPDGCFDTDTNKLRDCMGDGHHECRRCTRFEAKS